MADQYPATMDFMMPFSQPNTCIGTIGIRELKFQLSIQKLQNSAHTTKLSLASSVLEGSSGKLSDCSAISRGPHKIIAHCMCTQYLMSPT
jgi:hypothetical protein